MVESLRTGNRVCSMPLGFWLKVEKHIGEMIRKRSEYDLEYLIKPELCEKRTISDFA